MDLTYFDESKEYLHHGMIDWLSLRINLADLPEHTVRELKKDNLVLQCLNPVTGEIEWTGPCWEMAKSDEHRIRVRVGGYLEIQGSPARIGLLNNAFGSLDIQYCAQKMISFVSEFKGVVLPSFEYWRCTKIDVTRNYFLQSESEASQALNYLKQSTEGKQRHSTESNGFYIGKGSALHKGKVYLKGQDARRNLKLRKAAYTDEQLLKLDRVLRFEYTLGRLLIDRYFNQLNINWYQFTPEFLLSLHECYFKPYLSELEVTDMNNLLELLEGVAPTKGQAAAAAYDCYYRIRGKGFDQACATYPKSSWYRNLALLKKVGFSRADLNATNVIPIRKRAIELSISVRHWNEIELPKVG